MLLRFRWRACLAVLCVAGAALPVAVPASADTQPAVCSTAACGSSPCVDQACQTPIADSGEDGTTATVLFLALFTLLVVWGFPQVISQNARRRGPRRRARTPRSD